MSGRGDLFFAFFAAAAVHAGILAVGPGQSGGGAGDDGRDRISVAAASPSVAAVVRSWDTSPSTSEAQVLSSPNPAVEDYSGISREIPPKRVTQPETMPPALDARDTPVVAWTAPTGLQIPDPATSLPNEPSLETDTARKPAPPLESAPVVDALAAIGKSRPASDDAPRIAERPSPRPAASDSEAVARRTAAGTGGAGSRGSTIPASLPKTSEAERQAATSAWAAVIQRRIAHHHVYPRGTRDEGRVRVAMVVLPNGKLAEVSVARSSGSPALDKAAVLAVRRAAPFPPAPKSLTDQWYDIGQWIAFERR